MNKNKVKLLILMLVSIATFMPLTITASEAINIWIDGNYVKSTVAPYIHNGTTFVPLRLVSESLGYSVAWDNKTNEILINNENNQLSIKPNTIKAVHNGTLVNLSKPPAIRGVTTYLPIKDIAEKFGKNVAWDSKSRTVVIGDEYVAPVGNSPKEDQMYFSNISIYVSEKNTGVMSVINVGEVITASLDKLNSKYLIIKKNDKEYSVKKETLTPLEKSVVEVRKVSEAQDMNLAKKHSEGELKRVGTQDMYYVMSMLGIQKDQEVNFEKIVNEFDVTSNNNNDKIVDIIKHLNKYNLKYDPRTDTDQFQMQRISEGYSKCLGITRLGKSLLDKSKVPYRAVVVQYLDYSTDIRESRNGGHMYLQVKNNDGEWINFDLTLLILEVPESKLRNVEYIHEELNTPTNIFPKSLPKGLKTINYLISPEMENNKIIGNAIELFVVN